MEPRGHKRKQILLEGRVLKGSESQPRHLFSLMASGAPFSASHSFGPSVAFTTTAGAKSHPLQSISKPAPVVDLPALQSASRVLQDQLIKDAQVIPDLLDTLTTREI